MFRLEITTDNAAFEEDGCTEELATCLERVVHAVQRRTLRDRPEAGMIVDTNGNSVGTWRYTP